MSPFLGQTGWILVPLQKNSFPPEKRKIKDYFCGQYIFAFNITVHVRKLELLPKATLRARIVNEKSAEY